jgi:peptide/nickel transport system ATP-binding protein
VDLEIQRGETLGLVGETGCGKSVLALAIIGLVPHPGTIISGRVLFDEVDLSKISSEEMRALRQKKIAMIFQDPNAYLDPVFTVYEQVSEAIAAAYDMKMGSSLGMLNLLGITYRPRKNEPVSVGKIEEFLRETTMRALERARVPSPEGTMRSYPHELSGGIKQRSMIAMAVSKSPELLILDEATTALDVTTQTQILSLLRELKKELNTTFLMITHDLGVASEVCDRVAIMYAGEIVETGPTTDVLNAPLHPYTQALLRAIPRLAMRGKPLEDIPGQLPSAMKKVAGCLFLDRCRYAMTKCTQHPGVIRLSQDHSVRCYLYDEKEQPSAS